MTANFDRAALGDNDPGYKNTRSNREYLIKTKDPQTIRDLVAIFHADMDQKVNAKMPVPINAPHLVVSPGSRNRITDLIQSAKISLQIEMELITSDLITLMSEVRPSLGVRIIISDSQSDLQIPNATVRVARPGNQLPPKLKMHAKLIIIDGETAFVGSQNLTPNALDHNREVGIIITDPGIIQRLSKTFEEDWNSYGSN
jgi:cardiolipin synthase